MKNRFLKNTSWILAGQIIKLILSFVIGILTVRFLGPSNYGVLNYVKSYVTFFTAVIGLGLNGVIIYEFVNNKDQDGKILGTAITLRFILGVISTALLYGTVQIVDKGDHLIMVVTALQSIQLPFLCLDTINYWYQYQLKSKYSVIAQTLAYVVMSGYKVYLLVAQKGVAWFAFATSLDFIVLGIAYFIIWYKQHENPLKFDRAIAKRILRSCIPFVLANVMVVIYGQVDKVMIKHMMGSEVEVGLYSAAIAICSYIGFIPMSILDSGRPLIAEAKNTGEELYILRFKQLMAGIIWICLFYSLFITILSPLILDILYGDAYADANTCLRIAVWYTAFSYVGSARSFWLICEKKNKYVFVFSLMGAVGNIILNLIMIPIWGKEGAALATLLTQMLANFFFPALFKDTREYSRLALEAILLRDIHAKEAMLLLKKRFRKQR